MSGLPPYQFLPPGHPAWHQALMAQQQAQIAAQVESRLFSGREEKTELFLPRCKHRPNKQRRWLPMPRQPRLLCTSSSKEVKALPLPWDLLAYLLLHLS